jgi:HEAT repeat protein
MGFFYFLRPNVARMQKRGDVTGLIAALQRNEKGIRVAAAMALGKIGDTRAVVPLVAALKDTDVKLCQAAAEALGKLGDAHAVEPLLAMLCKSLNSISIRGEQERLSNSAILALGAIGRPAVEPLVAVLKNPDSNMRKAAALALNTTGAPSDPHIQAWHIVAKEEWDKAVAMDTMAVEPLICALNSSNHYSFGVRKAAAEALGAIGAPLAADALVKALKDTSTEVRQAAAKSLGQFGDALAVDALVQTLKDSNENMRQAAAESLGKIGDTRAMKPLIAALKEEANVYAAGAMAKALGTFGEPALELLKALIKEDWNGAACDALETIAPNDPNLQAWFVVNKREWDKALAMGTEAVEPLISAFRPTGYYEHLIAVAEALGVIGDPRAVDTLAAAFEDNFNSHTGVRRAAAKALGEIGDARAVKPLLEALMSVTRWEDRFICNDAGWIKASGNLFGDYTELILKAAGGITRHSDTDYNEENITTYDYDISEKINAVNELCRINTPVSNIILKNISTKLRDMTVICVSGGVMHGDRIRLDFEPIRQRARQELAQRGNPAHDDSLYLTKEAWKMIDNKQASSLGSDQANRLL